MEVFGTSTRGDRGVIHKIIDASSGKGTSLTFGDTPSSTFALVTNLQLSRGEVYSIKTCFGDSAYLYAFGDNIASSSMSVTVVTAMSRLYNAATSGGSCTEKDYFGELLKSYESNRIYNVAKTNGTGKLANLYYGGDTPLQGYLVGLNSAAADLEHMLQQVTFQFIMVTK